MARKIQRNPSTGKISRNPVTDKIQVVTASYNCTNCSGGTELPLIFECVISDFTVPDDGCCDETFQEDPSVNFDNMPDLNGTHLLPWLQACTHVKEIVVSAYTIDTYSGAECSVEISISYGDTDLRLILTLTNTQAEFTAWISGASINYFRARETYVDMGYTDCADFAQGLQDGDVISLTTIAEDNNWCKDSGFGSVTIAKG